MNGASSYYLALPAVFVAGVCIVGYQGVSYALIGEIAGKSRTGAGLGMMITINAGAATIGTPVFGYIVDRTGSYAIGWSVLAATNFRRCFGACDSTQRAAPAAYLNDCELEIRAGNKKSSQVSSEKWSRAQFCQHSSKYKRTQNGNDC